MKRHILLTLTMTIFICLCSFAQDNKYGITLSFNSPNNIVANYRGGPSSGTNISYKLSQLPISLGLAFNYKFKEKTFARLRFGFNKQDIYEEQEEKTWCGNSFEESTNKQTNWYFSPGLTWNLNNSKCTFTYGFEIPYYFMGEFKASMTSTNYDTTGALVGYYYLTWSYPKGYSVGLGAFAGLNYLLFKCCSIGAEFSPAIHYSRLKGTYIHTDNVNATYNINTSYVNDQIYYFQRFSINLLIWF